MNDESQQGPRPTEAVPEDDCIIRFRLSDLDSVMLHEHEAQPFDVRVSPFVKSGTVLRSVPVIRIFGATDHGQRVVAHVHGVYSYLFVEYKGGKLDPDTGESPFPLNTYIFRLGNSLNQALDMTQRRRPQSGAQHRPPQDPQHVAFIVLVKAVPIYGYHVGYKPYLKIYITNPRNKTRTSELLRSGAVMGTKFDVFESHVPYHLQFMLDANLYGCGWVEVSDEARFRTPLPDDAPASSFYYGKPSIAGPFGTRVYTEETVPAALRHPLDDRSPDKSSHCPIEIDVPLSAIINRRRLHPRDIHHDFVELLRPETVEVDKLVKSLKELWDDEQRRRTARGEPGPKDVKDTEPREWDDRAVDEPHWQLEADLRRKAYALAAKSKSQFHALMQSQKDPDFVDYVEKIQRAEGVQVGFLNRVRTSFDSYDTLFQSRMRYDERTQFEYGAWAVRGIGIDMGRGEHEMVIDHDIISRTQATFDRADTLDVDEDVIEGRGQDFARDDELDLNAEVTGEEEDDADHASDEFKDVKDEGGEDAALALAGSLSPTPTASAESTESAEGRPSPLKRAKRVHVVTMPTPFQRRETEGSQARQPQVHSPAIKAPAMTQLESDFADSSASPRRYAPRNPFASPDKAVLVRRVQQGTPLPSREPSTDGDEMPLLTFREDASEASDEVDAAPKPQQNPPVLEAEVEELENLPSSAFNEYRPTPTIRATQQYDTVPVNLRSTTDEELALPISSNRSSSTSASELPPLEESSNDDPSAGTLPKSSFRKTVTFTVDAPAATELQTSTASSATESKVLPPLRSTLSSETVSHRTTTTDSGPDLPKPVRQHAFARNAFVWSRKPPLATELVESLESYGQPRVLYRDPFYGDPADIAKSSLSKDRSAITREYGGRVFKIKDDSIRNVPAFEHYGARRERDGMRSCRTRAVQEWEFIEKPPTCKEIVRWAKVDADTAERAQQKVRMRQIEGPTQKDNRFHVQAVAGSTSQREPQHMSILAIELHVNTRGKLLPNPKEDEIKALFYCLKSEDERVKKNGHSADTHIGVIAVGNPDLRRQFGGHTNEPAGDDKGRPDDFVLDIVGTELDLIELFVEKLTQEWDPEAVAGYETLNWIDRADENLVPRLGRVIDHDTGRHGDAKSDRWGFNQASTLNFTGRHVLPIWRILKADNHLQYNSFEHVVFQTLTTWYNSGEPHKVSRVFAYWQERVELDLDMLDAMEFIEQTWYVFPESARVFGVDFRSVRTRGSQFKVESVMFKLSKPESFMMLSPSRPDVGRQNAAECQPLIMEPQSAFYKGPLVVLDFQSLYPSVMIAYNFCFSTCLGRVEPFKGTTKFGTSNLEHPPGLIELLKDHINISPNGMMFVKPQVRKSLVARMLTELLDTRVMVKTSMKLVEKDKSLLKLMNARQLALKYLANVTYGYIGATFSGRMPCVEIADAIVQTGRETLEKALRTIHEKKEWGARVVYGDTDSLFIYLPGKSKEDAFRIGNEMADYITSRNPRPIKLKFEKVYLPCVLLAKKRYTGYKYEKLTDTPEIEAKGIEIIRRDGIPGLQKMEDQCLRLLFTTQDLSQVKSYCQRQWAKLLANNASPQDFIIAKAVKLGTYAEDRQPPPGAAVAARMKAQDPRGEPEYGERVPYILFQAEPGTNQVDRAVSPEEFLADPRMRLDAYHYIEAMMLKPLGRIFDLIGADVQAWWRELPKKKIVVKPKGPNGAAKVLLDEHFVSDRCAICKQPDGHGGLCQSCKDDPSGSAYKAYARLRNIESTRQALHEVCASCSAQHDGEPIACDSVDCPIRWDRAAVDIERADAVNLVRLVNEST
ncbi:DNA polymerase zeta [Microbotryomycetes sp. JL201]|nr:DNA polymerase zeta [Microbotryomycetes sp. JL201]